MKIQGDDPRGSREQLVISVYLFYRQDLQEVFVPPEMFFSALWLVVFVFCSESFPWDLVCIRELGALPALFADFCEHQH